MQAGSCLGNTDPLAYKNVVLYIKTVSFGKVCNIFITCLGPDQQKTLVVCRQMNQTQVENLE